MNDLRFAFRQLLKNPGFTIVATTLVTAVDQESWIHRRGHARAGDLHRRQPADLCGRR